MSRARNKPLLIRQVRLWWYPVALVPILALAWVGLSGDASPFVGLISLFLLFFWIFSFGFAIAGKLRKPRDPRQ